MLHILLQPSDDKNSICKLYTILYFIPVHFFTVKSDTVLHAKTRVYLIWISLIGMINIDETHHTTNKNWMITTISMIFAMLQYDIVRLHCTTSEQPGHSITTMLTITQEFTVLELDNIINKLS